jgi:perosamine synthetase
MQYQFVIDFIRTIFGVERGFIPLHMPYFNGNEKKYLEECIDTTFVSSVGKFVDLFEEKIAEYTGAKKAVACVNGTNALHIALLLIGVERDTEVITQPLTFIATANAISYCGAHPVFLDVDLDTLGLSPTALRNWLEQNVDLVKTEDLPKPPQPSKLPKPLYTPINKTTRRPISACVPMHTFGHPARIDEIVEICNEYNMPVVEDTAESLGSTYKGQHTGTFGKIGVMSFNGNKIITTGGGGMLLLQDEALAKKAKHLTTQAKVPHAWEFIHDEIGYNYRMPNVNAAIGLAQLEQLPKFLDAKRNVATAYRQFFSESSINYVDEPINASSNFWLNCVLLPNKEQREEFLKFTNENGVMTRPVWELMNRLSMFKTAQCGDLRNATWIADRLVNIPSSVFFKMRKIPIILIGGGGHCISCIDVIELQGKYNIIGILDLQERVGENILDYEIIGTDEQITGFVKQCPDFLITVGQIKSAKIRQRIYKSVKEAGGNLPVVLSPLSHISKHAIIGEGTIIMHHAIVNANAKIGKCGIINSKALIEHEATVGNFTHISTGSIINGQTKVGNQCFIGSNAVVSNNTVIADNSIIAAGSQVLKNIEYPGIYIGNPLRKIKQ